MEGWLGLEVHVRRSLSSLGLHVQRPPKKGSEQLHDSLGSALGMLSSSWHAELVMAWAGD